MQPDSDLDISYIRTIYWQIKGTDDSNTTRFGGKCAISNGRYQSSPFSTQCTLTAQIPNPKHLTSRLQLISIAGTSKYCQASSQSARQIQSSSSRLPSALIRKPADHTNSKNAIRRIGSSGPRHVHSTDVAETMIRRGDSIPSSPRTHICTVDRISVQFPFESSFQRACPTMLSAKSREQRSNLEGTLAKLSIRPSCPRVQRLDVHCLSNGTTFPLQSPDGLEAQLIAAKAQGRQLKSSPTSNAIYGSR